MSAVSLRLPDHLEQQLNEEARLSGQPRSQLMREALETLLSQRREGRAQAALRLAACSRLIQPGSRERETSQPLTPRTTMDVILLSGDSENWSGGDTKTGPPCGANH
jgi:Arc/MetJ-type ribon-helix-helix transcriptional regulator